jgi:hypothetical protein
MRGRLPKYRVRLETKHLERLKALVRRRSPGHWFSAPRLCCCRIEGSESGKFATRLRQAFTTRLALGSSQRLVAPPHACKDARARFGLKGWRRRARATAAPIRRGARADGTSESVRARFGREVGAEGRARRRHRTRAKVSRQSSGSAGAWLRGAGRRRPWASRIAPARGGKPFMPSSHRPNPRRRTPGVIVASRRRGAPSMPLTFSFDLLPDFRVITWTGIDVAGWKRALLQAGRAPACTVLFTRCRDWGRRHFPGA